MSIVKKGMMFSRAVTAPGIKAQINAKSLWISHSNFQNHRSYIKQPTTPGRTITDNTATMLIPRADRKKIHEYLFRGMHGVNVMRRKILMAK
jgi:hypothetical protein